MLYTLAILLDPPPTLVRLLFNSYCFCFDENTVFYAGHQWEYTFSFLFLFYMFKKIDNRIYWGFLMRNELLDSSVFISMNKNIGT